MHQIHNMQNVTASTARRSAYAQSKVSNRRKLLLGIDGRSATARRFRDIIMDLVHECGGEESLSTAELGLIRQAAAMTLQAEVLQTRIVLGNPVSADELVRLSSEARRVMNSLNKRKPEPAVPDLRSYLASLAPEAASSETCPPAEPQPPVSANQPDGGARESASTATAEDDGLLDDNEDDA
jgi:hypothetical protein